MEFKLKSLRDNTDPPDYFYTDPDLINLFYDVKTDFILKSGINNVNYDSYNDALICANTILHIKNDMELKLCKTPRYPPSIDNFAQNVAQYDTDCKETLENSYENYQIATEQLNICLNHLHALIYSASTDIITSAKHTQIMDRAHILLKRNLDIIKRIHNNKGDLNYKTKIIIDYDLAKPERSKKLGNFF